MSLRARTVYTVNVGGGAGAAVPLKGGAQPFTTQESDDDDPFCPIRTQTGYLRIVDDGRDANGNALEADWWKDLIPATGTSRPVTLTHQEGGQTIVDWQGFMQAQTFSGALYGNPQEREFPIQCVLSSLSKYDIPTNETALRNFAYLLRLFITSSGITVNNVIVQGGADAQQWMLAMVDWRNFMNTGKQTYTSKYKFYEILEDICRFWGWTCRTWRQNIYLTMADDASEQSYLTLTMAQLETMAGGTAAGTVTSSIPSVTLSGDIFASTQNDDIQVRGYSKATVKADANKETTIFEFAPQSVVDTMEANGYTWVSEDGSYIGYFTTQEINGFTSNSLIGESSSKGAYARRQLFSDEDEGDANVVDVMLFKDWADINTNTNPWTVGTPYITLQTVFETAFSAGSLKITGTPYDGSESKANTGAARLFIAAIGIGHTKNTAKWLQVKNNISPTYYGWTTEKIPVLISVNWAPSLRVGAISPMQENYAFFSIGDSIPVPDDLYGYLYIDIYGTYDISGGGTRITQNGKWQLANLKVEYSREKIEVSSNGYRKVVRDRNSTKEYTAENQNANNEKWNADCIFASDNDMEYGYGLMLKGNGEYLKTAPYGGVQEIPEQHLANRVAAYGATSKRQFMLEVRQNAISQITPINKVSFESTSCQPVSIGHDWRDDVVQLKMIEL